MSELKATTVYDAYWKANSVGEGTGMLVYLKSEADKVITELKDKLRHYPMMVALLESDKKEIAKLKDKALQYKVLNKEHCRDLNTQERFFAEQIAHQKYKRCLAMARWCKDKMDAIQNGYMRSNIESQNGVMTTCPPECNPKFSFYFKWQNRWHELADKFEEEVK